LVATILWASALERALEKSQLRSAWATRARLARSSTTAIEAISIREEEEEEGVKDARNSKQSVLRCCAQSCLIKGLKRGGKGGVFFRGKQSMQCSNAGGVEALIDFETVGAAPRELLGACSGLG
jgi:hypothetical protein